MEEYQNDDNNKRLTRIFAEAGAAFGYPDVNAEFMAFRDFKCRWQRSYRWADFRISDYLDDAPDEVLRALAESLFRRIAGEEDEFDAVLREWITAPEFVALKQDIYLSRCMNYSRTVVGKSKNLQEAYDRLIGAGLVPYDPSIVLTWTSDSMTRKVGFCSVLMRTVAISDVLDKDEVPDYVLDYCLYHELCHIMSGFNPGAEEQHDDFRALESRFPEKYAAQDWMKSICAYV